MFLHGAGWIHQDVNISNILLDADNNVRLADLEYAKKSTDPSTHRVRTVSLHTRYCHDPASLLPQSFVTCSRQLKHRDVDASLSLQSLSQLLYKTLWRHST